MVTASGNYLNCFIFLQDCGQTRSAQRPSKVRGTPSRRTGWLRSWWHWLDTTQIRTIKRGIWRSNWKWNFLKNKKSYAYDPILLKAIIAPRLITNFALRKFRRTQKSDCDMITRDIKERMKRKKNRRRIEKKSKEKREIKVQIKIGTSKLEMKKKERVSIESSTLCIKMKNF